MEKCELCSFNNPKATATAVIIRDNKLLLLKRAEEPFKGKWDFPGGFIAGTESPERALLRELSEELDVAADLTFFMTVSGTAQWKEKVFPIISFCYLADIGNQEIKLNAENSELTWIPLKDLKPWEVAFDSNIVLATMTRNKFTYDLDRVRELTRQLDSSATVNEQSLYKAILNGFVSCRYDQGNLVGMGWIFLRQTMLRKQAVVEDMIVDDSMRGRGFGRSILEDLLGWAKEQKCEMVELTTNPKRVAAHALYEKMGFVIHPTDHMLLKI